MQEVPSGLALEESGDCVVKDLSKFAPRSFQWHATEVKVSHKMLMNLSNTDMEMLASFERPPYVVNLVMHAVHELLGIKNLSWVGMKKMLNVDVPKPEDRRNEPLPHEQFQAALAESASHKSWRLAGDKASEYPTPVKHQHVARIIKLVLEYTGQGRDPKQVLKMLKKYVSNPEFMPENAGKWSKAALALCVWVHAVQLHYKELKRKPGRWQIEKAIEHGSGHMRFPSNTRVVVSACVVTASAYSLDCSARACVSLSAWRRRLVRRRDRGLAFAPRRTLVLRLCPSHVHIDNPLSADGA